MPLRLPCGFCDECPLFILQDYYSIPTGTVSTLSVRGSRMGASEINAPWPIGCLREVLSRVLFVALKRRARDFGLRFEMDSSRQFVNDLEVFREAESDVVISKKRYGTKRFTIQAVD